MVRRSRHRRISRPQPPGAVIHRRAGTKQRVPIRRVPAIVFALLSSVQREPGRPIVRKITLGAFERADFVAISNTDVVAEVVADVRF